MPASLLGPGPEFDRVRAILAALGPTAQGIGDDCAVLLAQDRPLVVSTDVSVEGVHFERAWLGAEEIGWRAAASALSDLAAMGAAAIGLVCAVALPAGTPPEEITALMRGVGQAAKAAGGTVLGGDLSGAERWSVAVTVLGTAERPVYRSGARPGDGLWVTGALGGARAAVQAWLAGREPEPAHYHRFAHPEPRVAAGRWLAAHGATALIDLSDGLAADAQHLAAASGARAVIELERVPRDVDVPTAEAAAQGGEDYELLAALPPAFDEGEAARCVVEGGVPLVRVGRVEAGEGLALLRAGRPVVLEGFDHFR
ncbi:MAG: thiamine-phosphate kinase [Gemmatimonadales bacterium]|nr:thiamine-phosphate kinase [Gemmatimonadales bacterium]